MRGRTARSSLQFDLTSCFSPKSTALLLIILPSHLPEQICFFHIFIFNILEARRDHEQPPMSTYLSFFPPPFVSETHCYSGPFSGCSPLSVRSSDFSPLSAAGGGVEDDAREPRGRMQRETRSSGAGGFGGSSGWGDGSGGNGGGGKGGSGGRGDRGDRGARGARAEEGVEDVYDFDATDSSRYFCAKI